MYNSYFSLADPSMLSRDEKTLARIIFKTKVLTANGQAYEDLFVDVMQKANKDFRPVKPQGSYGDRKNDGYDYTAGRYYQVFAPEDPTLSTSQARAVTKAKTDFAGLLAYWSSICAIQEYHFVYNDKYEGTFPTIEAELAAIKAAHGLDKTSVFLAKDLENHLFVLDDDEVLSVIGFIPNPDSIVTLDFSILTEVIRHILQQKRPLDPNRLLVAPDFDEKIRFNKLSLPVGGLLHGASLHIGLLEQYFLKNGNFLRQQLRDIISELYATARTKDFSAQAPAGNVNDYVFFDILNAVTPETDDRGDGLQNAALVLLAYFFESCDIFEEPQSVEMH